MGQEPVPNEIRRASEEWRNSLIDVGGSNRLLYFKPNSSTIDLSTASSRGLTKLLSGTTVRLSELFSDPTSLRGAQRACAALARKQREATEEYGVSVAYLAAGLATWDPNANESISAAEHSQTGDEPEPHDDTARKRPAHLNPSAPVLLRPLELSLKRGAQEAWELTLDEDFQFNGVLEHVMNADRERLDDDDILLDDDGTSAAVDLMLNSVEIACADVPGFSIDAKYFLGAFSYLKQPMVADIDDLDALSKSDLVAALAGAPEAAARVRAFSDGVSEEQPDYTPVESEFLVLDADASQSFVVNAAVAGRNLVVEGPPGTGKSQTIANVIAAMTAAGKSVLFVAQKRAAVTAVLDRLDSETVDLSHLVLDLFASVASRRYIAEQLREVLDRQKMTGVPNVDSLQYTLESSRDRLVGHRDELFSKRGLDASVTELRVMSAGLPAAAQSDLRLPSATFEDWDRSDLVKHAQQLDELEKLQALTPSWTQSSGWNPSVLIEAQIVQRHSDILRALSAVDLPQFKRAIERVAAEVGETPPRSWTEWHSFRARLTEILEVQNKTPEALAVSRSDLEEMLIVTDRKYRRNSDVQLTWGQRREARRRTKLVAPGMSRKTAHSWLVRTSEVHQTWRGAGIPSFPDSVQAADLAVAPVKSGLDALQTGVQNITLGQLDFAQLDTQLRQLAAQTSRASMPRAHQLEQDLVAAGCGPLLDRLRTKSDLPTTAGLTLQWIAVHSVLEDAVMTSPHLAGISGDDLDEATETFQRADKEHLGANAARIRRIAAENLKATLDSFQDQHSILKTEVTRKRNFRAVRTLFREAPDVLLAAKPVWAMSPLQVSRLLPPVPCFDVVIFDEASQVKPADGIPSLLRARQAIIAGDSRQLPPTEFFSKVLDDLPPKEDEDDLEALVASEQGALDAEVHTPKRRPTAQSFTRDAESILFAMDRVLAGQSRRLLWHYRSRDERLIAVSNAYVYSNSLTTFPSADSADALRHVTIPPSKGIRNTTNSPEAEVAAVVQLLKDQIRDHPDESVGVITFGEAHQRRIEIALAAAMVDDPEFTATLTGNAVEPYFVKSIERVQGDERDAIILTVGYGKGLDGKLRYFWGPLLQEGGERRLNVAISRAKRRLTLVTSFGADDVPDDGHHSAGFKLMYRFLRFMASNGKELAGGPSRSTVLNAFEIDVQNRLQAAGLHLDPQVGVGSYRIDFAARHPTKPGRQVMAIEADGAAYHSGHIARERDRLRQSLLEGRGWIFHRIWSTDWFNDADREVQRAVDAFEGAVKAIDMAASELAIAPEPWDAATASWSVETGVRDYPLPSFRLGGTITDYSRQTIVQLLLHIRSDNIIRTSDEEITEMMNALGFQRRGPRIIAALTSAQRYVDAARG
jgi:very-short-patch-repair endonuclease